MTCLYIFVLYIYIYIYIYILFDLIFIFILINNDVDNGMHILVGNTHLEFAKSVEYYRATKKKSKTQFIL